MMPPPPARAASARDGKASQSEMSKPRTGNADEDPGRSNVQIRHIENIPRQWEGDIELSGLSELPIEQRNDVHVDKAMSGTMTQPGTPASRSIMTI